MASQVNTQCTDLCLCPFLSYALIACFVPCTLFRPASHHGILHSLRCFLCLCISNFGKNISKKWDRPPSGYAWHPPVETTRCQLLGRCEVVTGNGSPLVAASPSPRPSAVRFPFGAALPAETRLFVVWCKEIGVYAPLALRAASQLSCAVPARAEAQPNSKDISVMSWNKCHLEEGHTSR